MCNVFYFGWEVTFIEFLQNQLPDWFMRFFELVTNLGDQLALICVVGLIYWCLDKKIGMRLCLFLSAVGTFFPMIKNLVCRSRPYMDINTIRCVQPAYDGDIYDISVQGYSFPSGHACTCSTVYGGIIARYKNTFLRVLLLLVILLVCLSRCALGVHFPTDVLAGLVLGVLTMLLIQILDKKSTRKVYYPLLAAIGLVGYLYCGSEDYYTGYGILLGAMLSDVFERRYVRFEKAEGFWECLIRMVGGLGIFLIFSTALKLPFTESFLNSGTFLSHLVRTTRYIVLMFLDLALYPLLFRYIKIGKHATKATERNDENEQNQE